MADFVLTTNRDMGDESQLNEGHATFAETCSENLSSKTRKQYRSKFNNFLEFLRRERDLSVTEMDQIDLDEVTIDEYEGFFERVQVKRVKGPFSDPVLPMKYNDTQTISGYRAALIYEMKERKKAIPQGTLDELNRFMSGYKRKIAELKEKGEMSMGEGKAPIPFSAYRILAKKALEAIHDIQQGMFSHTYLLLCWNLMARSHSVAKICLQHIGWEEVRLLIRFMWHVHVCIVHVFGRMQ